MRRLHVVNTPGYLLLLFLLWGQNPLQAQIIPDNTLLEKSQVTINGNTFRIDGGTTAGTNLFHSFSDFSLPTNHEAFFNNSGAINNIISRVIGGNLSQIDGLIRANGNANLFLLNPNGIIFGSHAALNIGGSFIASTADSIIFDNGSVFSSTNPEALPLLTVSIPIGLQFRQNSGTIQVQGTGHQLFLIGQTPLESLSSPLLGRQFSRGLEVKSGNTIALIGGDVLIQGGTLRAEEGRIELGSVKSGHVSLIPSPQGWAFRYDDASTFADIALTQKALVDVSGFGSGSIQLQGSRISLADGSVMLSQNEGFQTGGNISIYAAELLQLTGTSPDGRIRSQITTPVTGTGNGGEITVATRKLTIQEGGRIGTTVVFLPPTIRGISQGKGGDITVNATESIDLTGFSPLNPIYASQIIAETNGGGDAGDIAVFTEQLTFLNGANIVSTANIGTGSGGGVNIQAKRAIHLIGVNPLTLFPSSIATSTILSSGNAGNLTVTTPRLLLRDGGRIDASAFATGNAGSIIINALESIELRGSDPKTITPSKIISSADLLDPRLANQLGIPQQPTGDSGNVILNTGNLLIIDGALVTVNNDGTGDAGNLVIDAGSIFLDNKNGITASTASGEGGNITLNVKNLLQLRHNSVINATANGTGNGGNITIDSPLLVGLENSDITANSSGGQGGAINITAEGVFGLQIRDMLTSNNDITAFSELEPALNGTVSLNLPDIDPSRGITELPSNVIDPTVLIAQNPCKKVAQSEFIVTGRGGLPPSINEDLSNGAVQVNLVEPVSTVGTEGQAQKFSLDTAKIQNTIVPAQGWVFNDKGEIVLTAYNPNVTGPQRIQEKSNTCPVPASTQ